MVINSDSDDSSTTKRNDIVKPRYRPQFLDHFERKNSSGDICEKSTEYLPTVAHVAITAAQTNNKASSLSNHNLNNHQQQHLAFSNVNSNVTNWEKNMEIHFQQIAAINQYGLQQHQQHLQQQKQHAAADVATTAYYSVNPIINEQHILALNQQHQMQSPSANLQQHLQQRQSAANQYHPHHHLHTQSNTYVDGEFEFLKFLTFDDLNQRLNNIDSEMEKEIEELNKKYNAKRQPIVDAMNAKRKRQQNINNNLIKI